jgi:hypothetical protein
LVDIEGQYCGPTKWSSGNKPTASAPFAASRNNTKFPGPWPSTRRTLVAPGFLLPTSKMFTPFAFATR